MTAEGSRSGAGSRDRIHVAHVGPDPTMPGGMAAVIAELMRSPGDGYRLEAIVSYDSGQALRRAIRFAMALASLLAWSLRPGRRIVHVHATVRGSLYRKTVCVLLARLLRRPVVLHVHSGVGDVEAFHARLRPWQRRFLGMAFTGADAVISVSAASARAVERLFGASDVEVVPNPAPQATLAPELAATRPRELRILYMGGFANPVKGGDVVLRALPELVEAVGEGCVTLAGPGEPPADWRSGLPAGARVRWAGWLEGEAKQRALASASVFLLPSTSEGLPIALLEAMAHGCAVVATRVGGIPEVVTDGRDGLLVEPDDVAALVRAVGRLVADPEARRMLGEAARERAGRSSVAELGRQLDTVYRRVAPR